MMQGIFIPEIINGVMVDNSQSVFNLPKYFRCMNAGYFCSSEFMNNARMPDQFN
jgi:hypothetical protein